MHILKTIWKFIKWPFLILLALFVIGVLLRIPAVGEMERSKEMVEYINTRHLTMADVDGSRLPPPVSEAEKDATIEGVDINNNDIRDDVERELFTRYPDDIEKRAAMLQYAMTQQMYLTRVFTTETLDAVNLQDDRAMFCVGYLISLPWNPSEVNFESLSEKEMYAYQELATQHSRAQDALTNEVTQLVRNTKSREEAVEEVFEKYFDGGPSGRPPYCDVFPEKE